MKGGCLVEQRGLGKGVYFGEARGEIDISEPGVEFINGRFGRWKGLNYDIMVVLNDLFSEGEAGEVS